jgi:tRNA (guanine-N7-)-methyltransferase
MLNVQENVDERALNIQHSTFNTEELLEIDPRQTGFELLDLRALFGNDNPVVLELGSGKGRFLLMSAAEHTARNFIGIEKSLHYHRVIRARAARRGLTNIRLINHDAFLVLSKMLPDRSIAEVHIYFPDPWPRPRERKRRMIRQEMLEQVRRILVEAGSGIYVTDHEEYFEKSAPLIAQYFRSETRTPGPADPPRTNYEAKYREEGRPIYEVRFWNERTADGGRRTGEAGAR